MSPKRRIIPIFVPHYGCPHDCVFCNQRHITGTQNPADAASVTDAIQQAVQIAGKDTTFEVAFYGGSFTAIPVSEQEALLGAVIPFRKVGIVHAVRLSTRPDCIDAEVLARLAQYGVTTIELGSQSMCEEVLRLSGRGHTAEATRVSATLIRKAGFQLILQMMTGLPGDTKERAVETANEIASLRPDGVRIYPAVILRDTALHRLWLTGQYKEHTVAEAIEWCSELLPVFQKAEIPVIRLGLNPSEELSGGLAVAGAYHPAFGELVRSRIWFKKFLPALQGLGPKKEVCIGVPRGSLSAATGQKRCNILQLQQECGVEKVRFLETDCPSESFEIISVTE